MFDHTTTIDTRHHERLERISNDLKDIRSESDVLTDGQRSKLSMLATLYRMSTTMPDEAKISLWLNGPTVRVRLEDAYSGDSTRHAGLSAQVIDDLRSEIKDLRELVKSTQTITHEITINDGDAVQIKGRVHEVFGQVLDWVALNENVYLVGPAGSGKTTIAAQIAEALDLDFYVYGSISQDFQFLGHIGANGEYVETDFYRAFKHGGLVLFDEMDGSNPNALMALNAALANDFAAFPCGIVQRHPDFRVIASGNTFGHGASAQYVGRNPMDAATLDRFLYIPMGYDHELERALACNDVWVDLIQASRAQVEQHKIRHVVSPRASIKGAKGLAAGMPWGRVIDQLIFNKGWTDTDKAKVLDGIDISIIDAINEAA